MIVLHMITMKINDDNRLARIKDIPRDRLIDEINEEFNNTYRKEKPKVKVK